MEETVDTNGGERMAVFSPQSTTGPEFIPAEPPATLIDELRMQAKPDAPHPLGTVDHSSTSHLNHVNKPDGYAHIPSVSRPLGLLSQIPITVKVILGRTKMPLSKVMALGPGSIISLDQKLSEPALLTVNGNEIAKGTIVILNEDTCQLGITITEISNEPISRGGAGQV
jgi:flagellar motor switch protein FliN